MAAGKIEKAPRSNAGIINDREDHQIDAAEISHARAEKKRFPNVPVAHDIVDTAPAVLEPAVPDPDVHRIPIQCLDGGGAAEELAAEHGVLRLTGGFRRAEDQAVGRVAED